MKLPSCYVLIESLQVPEDHHFQPVGETIEETLNKLSLNDPEDEDDEEQGNRDGKEEMSDSEESEPEIELVRQRDDAQRDKGVKKCLTEMQKTKII